MAANIHSLALIGMWEAIAIIAILVLLFGAKKLPELARGLGQGIREFKKGSQELPEETEPENKTAKR